VNIYEASIYLLLISLSIAVLVGIRVAARKGATTSLAGLSGATIATATALVVLGEVVPIDYATDIALYLLLLSPIGTILLSRMTTEGGFQ